MFAYAKPEQESIWPPESVCKIIQEIHSDELDEGFRINVYNKRKMVIKLLSEGGQQEKVLADQYKQFSKHWASHYPRVSDILLRISEIYLNEVKREDQRAEIQDLEY